MKREFRPKPPRRTTESPPLPAACDAHDVASAFGASISTVHGWRKSGRLRIFELRKPIGSKRWSGRLLQEFLDGETNPLELIRRRA